MQASPHHALFCLPCGHVDNAIEEESLASGTPEVLRHQFCTASEVQLALPTGVHSVHIQVLDELPPHLYMNCMAFRPSDSLSSIHDSLAALEDSLRGPRPQERTHSDPLRHQHRELQSLKHEVAALKHMFLRRAAEDLNSELELDKAISQLAAGTERLAERRRQLSAERSHDLSAPAPLRIARSPGDFSFSNKETDETSRFSFGDTDENLEVRSETKTPPSWEGLEHFQVVYLPFIYEPRHTGIQPSKSFPILLGKRIAERYRMDAIMASTSFSTVLACYDTQKRCDVCVKVLHNQKEVLDQGLDELKVWRLLEAECGDTMKERHLVRLLDFFYYREHLFLVSELHGENLYLIGTEPETRKLLSPDTVRRVIRQLLEALASLHSLGIIHADVKPENVLLSSSVRKLRSPPPTVDIVLADFGSSCFLTDESTTYIQSQAYRAPEVLVGAPYSTKIDIWSVGCVLAELITGEVLLPASSAEESLFKIKCVLGQMPTSGRLLSTYTAALKEATLERVSSLDELFEPSHLREFLHWVLQVDPDQRPSAEEALQHPWLL